MIAFYFSRLFIFFYFFPENKRCGGTVECGTVGVRIRRAGCVENFIFTAYLECLLSRHCIIVSSSRFIYVSCKNFDLSQANSCLFRPFTRKVLQSVTSVTECVLREGTKTWPRCQSRRDCICKQVLIRNVAKTVINTRLRNGRDVNLASRRFGTLLLLYYCFTHSLRRSRGVRVMKIGRREKIIAGMTVPG
ncbi:hypothetical protein PUN28_007032 [Cardiocondyla obscurior]|uniref:Secreted protein n=1 Tax=Cardiocondyla obscurior TaxID=286306 RepID=A0AAW2G690_9HYME